MSVYQGFGRENNNQQASFNAGSFPMAGGSMGGGFSHKASILPTDMRCYFGCNQGFKKDYDLRLHIKLKHRDQSEEELQRAYQDAEEEIALVTRTQSKFQCALCPKVLTDNGAFFVTSKRAITCNGETTQINMGVAKSNQLRSNVKFVAGWLNTAEIPFMVI